MTYRELVYMVLDSLKISSDDSYITEDHVLFLLTKFRSALLKLTYSDVRKEIPESNYLNIELSLTEVQDSEGLGNIGDPINTGEYYLKTIKALPTILPVGVTKVYLNNFYLDEITFISRERMKYVGRNKWLKNIIYASLGPNLHIYLKSNSSTLLDLVSIKVLGIFEDSLEAAKLAVDKLEVSDILDLLFPIEEGLVSTLIELCVKFLSSAIYKPKDPNNDAADNLSEIMTFIRQNMKSNLLKLIES